MAITLSFKVDGKMKTFKKDDIYFSDNIRAVKHSIVQTDFYSKKDATKEDYENMQNDYCEMIADIFDNDFSAEQLKTGLTISKLDELDAIYLKALGGEKKESDDNEKKKK